MCVTGGGVGVDNVQAQKKLEARISSKSATNPRRPVHAVLGGFWGYKKPLLRRVARKNLAAF
jgi:hypothetical protein